MPDVLPTVRVVLPCASVLSDVDPSPPGVLPCLPEPLPKKMSCPFRLTVVCVVPLPRRTTLLRLATMLALRVKLPAPSRTYWLFPHELIALFMVVVEAPLAIVAPHCVHEALGMP